MLNEVAQSFVVGAARSPDLEPIVTLGDRRYALPEELTAVERLLTRAGVAALTTLALTPAARPKLICAPPFPSEELHAVPLISPRATDLLKRMLSGNDTELVQEALEAIGRRGRRVPPELLPTLLNALDPSDKRAWLAPVQCAATRWLARQNPDWAWAAGSAEDDPLTVFEQETGKTRHEAFAVLRRRNADEARTLLAETFPRENAEERAALLKQCWHGLSSADEVFLESVLDDRAKTVRLVAADLLARLPESAFVKRTLEKTLPLIRMESGLMRKTLEVTLPDEPSKNDERDGIDPKATPDGLHKIGPRQLHLAQRVSYVPPVKWKEHLGLDFPDIVAHFGKHEFSSPLCVGLCIAAVRLKDTEALRATMVLAERKQTYLIYKNYVLENLSLLPDIPNIIAAKIKEKDDAIQWIWLCKTLLSIPWRDDISQAVLAWAKNPAHIGESTYYQFTAILRLAAMRVAADEKFLHDWPTIDRSTATPLQQRMADAMDQFHKVLQTRIRFLSALEKP